MPCHVKAVDGAIVTVSFDIVSTDPNQPVTLPDVTCPIFGPEYIRYPIQVGDLGVVIPIDFYIGGVSGLGGGVANFTQRGNLSTLVFFPIGNANWTASDDANALVMYGPDGVILRPENTKDLVKVEPGKITLSINNGFRLIITATGITLESSDGTQSLILDSANARSSGIFEAGNGVSGTFVSADFKVVTVSHGIITNFA